MPLYQYHCDTCGRDEDRMISLADFDRLIDAQRCEKCESMLRHVITPVAIKTTTRFMSGSGDGLPDDASRKIAYAKAEAAGISVSGKKFHPGLCPKGDPFSPHAWYSDESEVVKKAQALGRSVEGSINVKAPTRDEDYKQVEQPYRVARHLVADDVNREIAMKHNGKVSKAKREELYRKYQDKYSGSKTPKGKVRLGPG